MLPAELQEQLPEASSLPTAVTIGTEVAHGDTFTSNGPQAWTGALESSRASPSPPRTVPTYGHRDTDEAVMFAQQREKEVCSTLRLLAGPNTPELRRLCRCEGSCAAQVERMRVQVQVLARSHQQAQQRTHEVAESADEADALRSAQRAAQRTIATERSRTAAAVAELEQLRTAHETLAAGGHCSCAPQVALRFNYRSTGKVWQTLNIGK